MYIEFVLILFLSSAKIFEQHSEVSSSVHPTSVLMSSTRAVRQIVLEMCNPSPSPSCVVIDLSLGVEEEDDEETTKQ